MNKILIIVIPIIIVCVIAIISISIWWIKYINQKTKNLNKQYLKKDKNFYKEHKPISFKNFNNNQCGLVLASGIKKGSKIKNNVVLKNLNKKSLTKIDLKKLSVSVSNKRSAIVIAPPGTGKTQALLLPSIFYNIYSKNKPNMIITDPKPEIQNEVIYHLIKNGYQIINISLKEIKDKNNNYLSDYINPFNNIIHYHKKLIETSDKLEVEKYVSHLNIEINNIIDIICYKPNATNDYWSLNGKLFIKFVLAYLLFSVEIEELEYKNINPINLIQNINNIDFNFFKISLNKNKIKNSKTYRVISSFLSWSHERDENIASFKTNALIYLDFFNQHYISLLTSKTTIDIKKIIKSKKPFVFFITLNLANENEFEKNLINLYLSIIYHEINKLKDEDKEFKKKDIFWFIDEAGNINRINFLGQIISFGRGNNMFAVPIFQNENQINNLYGCDGLLDSCEYKILFSNTNEKLAKKISDLEGNYQTDKQQLKKEPNLDMTKVTNIPEGYIGVWKLVKKNRDKMFYILPIVYFYMLKNIKNKIVYKNHNYIVSDFIKIINNNLDNDLSSNNTIDQILKINIDKNFSPIKINSINQFAIWLKDEMIYYYNNIHINNINIQKIINKYNQFFHKENIKIQWLDRFIKFADDGINIMYKNKDFKNIYEKN